MITQQNVVQSNVHLCLVNHASELSLGAQCRTATSNAGRTGRDFSSPGEKLILSYDEQAPLGRSSHMQCSKPHIPLAPPTFFADLYATD